jgi:hypothetical protein
MTKCPISIAEIAARSPDLILPPDPAFSRQYWDRVDFGRREASRMRACFVAICRNAMPWIQFTLGRVQETGALFRDWKCFVYENDSSDGTREFLADSVKSCDRLHVSLNVKNRPHLNLTKSAERTFALAEYRNECRRWVREHASDYDYIVVFDSDPWGGWSANGVANSIGWLEDYENDLDESDSWHQDWGMAAGMASYSWCEWRMPALGNEIVRSHYDSWACRWNHWEERSGLWFNLWHPPVGSEPVRMNSAFGQLGLYRTQRYLEGIYRGGDCEHVSHWRTCGGDCYLNPSQRVVSFWHIDEPPDAQEKAGLHGDLHGHVAGGDSDADHRGNTADYR